MAAITVYAHGMGKIIKKPKHFHMRLSDEDAAYIEAVAAKMGLTQSAALMAAIRLLAERQKVKVNLPEPPQEGE